MQDNVQAQILKSRRTSFLRNSSTNIFSSPSPPPFTSSKRTPDPLARFDHLKKRLILISKDHDQAVSDLAKFQRKFTPLSQLKRSRTPDPVPFFLSPPVLAKQVRRPSLCSDITLGNKHSSLRLLTLNKHTLRIHDSTYGIGSTRQ